MKTGTKALGTYWFYQDPNFSAENRPANTLPNRILNVLTLSGTGYHVTLLRELKKYNIASLTEARLTGSGEHENGRLI